MAIVWVIVIVAGVILLRVASCLDSLKELQKNNASITELQFTLIETLIERALVAKARVLKRQIINTIESLET